MRFLPIFLILVGLLAIMACEEEGEVEVPITSPQATIVETPTPQLSTATPTLDVPAFSASECKYLHAVLQQSEQLRNAMGKLAPLLGQADLFSETWHLNIAAQLVTIQLIADDAHTLKPPSSLAPVHDQWLAATGLYADMVDRLIKGIDELDVAKIEAAIELMLRGTEALKIATSLMHDFNASRSGVCP